MLLALKGKIMVKSVWEIRYVLNSHDTA